MSWLAQLAYLEQWGLTLTTNMGTTAPIMVRSEADPPRPLSIPITILIDVVEAHAMAAKLVSEVF